MAKMFQFQNGAIKRQDMINKELEEDGFNSKMVRLRADKNIKNNIENQAFTKKIFEKIKKSVVYG